MPVTNDLKYSTKAFSQLTGVNASTIYYWRRTKFLVPYINAQGKAYYTQDHVEILEANRILRAPLISHETEQS